MQRVIYIFNYHECEILSKAFLKKYPRQFCGSVQTVELFLAFIGSMTGSFQCFAVSEEYFLLRL